MDKARNNDQFLLDKIYASIVSAPKAQSRVAHFIAQNPENILKHSVAELANFSGSGPASVVRFCRTLGYTGFREFKIALSAEIERDRNKGVIQRATARHNVAPEVLRVSDAIKTSISLTAEMLDYSIISDLVNKILLAERVEIFGMGASSICADLLTLRLIWLGLHVHAVHSAGMSHGLARTLNANGLAIGISHGGVSEDTISFLATARQAGARTLAITTRPDCPVANAAEDVLLLSSSGRWPESGSARLLPSMVLLSECVARCILDRRSNSQPVDSRT